MREEKVIYLPQPADRSKISLEEAITKRRSKRDFSNKELSIKEISQLLWAAQGITGKSGDSRLRAVPSAGALYPLEIYLLSKYGFFHYVPNGHTLEILGSKDLRTKLAFSSLGQTSVEHAAVDIVICGVSTRITDKYGGRGITYMYIEAGHVAQNIQLQAVVLGLGSVSIGAFNDEEVDKILALPEGCQSLYIVPVGYKK
ncbi:MAG: SagB/ThcOx family dehydrogenase [Candidatus Omnitrophica bacterium]|nr:SagB/ThcOx family dehydrogenase [Candidatus Omnitrophota bacterium]MBU1047835.1 SagB/ThcOx family dehydrogenase [Candidatus Omnitrophota bacterium]MBU1630521.1 SagB/ThcOx family dehydrogenase [Candidatus Omnitrophota bacterium]MBU1767553.1 SagB/ThcOx family dehydrogenase [Candidatus Omnitrophota bacterium]MBU1888457.1 SagB/ThcOx family dehydrogenase [Candidatus Omnitrophota bacterium]